MPRGDGLAAMAAAASAEVEDARFYGAETITSEVVVLAAEIQPFTWRERYSTPRAEHCLFRGGEFGVSDHRRYIA